MVLKGMQVFFLAHLLRRTKLFTIESLCKTSLPRQIIENNVDNFHNEYLDFQLQVFRLVPKSPSRMDNEFCYRFEDNFIKIVILFNFFGLDLFHQLISNSEECHPQSRLSIANLHKLFFL